MPERLLISIPIRSRRVHEVRVKFVLGTGDGDQAVCPSAIDLIDVVDLAVVVFRLLGADVLSRGYEVLEVDVREGEVVEDDVLGGEAGEAAEEGEVLLLRLLLRVVELAVGAVGPLLHLGDQLLLPPLRHVVRVLRRRLLVGVAAVPAVVGGARGGAVVELVGGLISR